MSQSEPSSHTRRILIAGVGSRLRGDDGFGPRVIDLLSARSLPENVELRDIGTAGITIATDLSEYDVVIFLDSMEMDGEPGLLRRVEVDVSDLDLDAGELARATLHEVGLEGLLKFSKTIGALPPRVVLVGCKPKDLSPSLKLSDEVERAAHEAVDMVLEILGLKCILPRKQIPFVHMKECGRVRAILYLGDVAYLLAPFV